MNYTQTFAENAVKLIRFLYVQTNSENDGMTMRVLKYIFSCGKTVQTCISFIEIYNDQAFDLLGQHPQEAFYKKGTVTFRL